VLVGVNLVGVNQDAEIHTVPGCVPIDGHNFIRSCSIAHGAETLNGICDVEDLQHL
jgi:hypothetical protein